MRKPFVDRSVHVTSTVALAVSVLASVVAVPAGVVAGGLSRVLEGAAGQRMEPAEWDYRVPSSVLGTRGMAVSFGTGAAYLLNREYDGSQGDNGYALSLQLGVRGAWDYGTTAIWISGGGQSQEWADPDGVFHLSPGAKTGAMAITHAYSNGDWSFGGTIYRASLSLTDEFEFDRFPQSGDHATNTYLYDLLPEAIGNTIDYSMAGTHFAGFLEARKRTEIGALAVIGGGWMGDVDVATRHVNAISDPNADNPLLRGAKNGVGIGDWRGWSLEGRWAATWQSFPEMEAWYGQGSWKGDGMLGLADRPYRFSETTGGEYLEPLDLAAAEIHTDAQQAGVEASWGDSRGIAWSAGGHWGKYSLSANAWGSTPTLMLVGEEGSSVPVYQRCGSLTDIDLTVVEGRTAVQTTIPGTRWNAGGMLGLVWSKGDLRFQTFPYTMLMHAEETDTRWQWSSLWLGYVEANLSRMLTSQISVAYTFRQYVPLGGSWSKNGASSGAPGGITGIRLGGLHTLRMTLNL